MSGFQQKAGETDGVKIDANAQEKAAEISDGGIEADIQENELKEPKLVLMSLQSKKPSLVHDVVGLDESGQSTYSPQKFFTPKAPVPESKQYQRKVFMQVEESRTPGQWIDYGKCNGITDDKLLPTILKGMSNLTVDRYDKDVQNIMSRIETGTPVVQDQLPPRLNACTIYPEPECSFGITREVTPSPDVSQKEIPKEIQKIQPDANNHVTPTIVNTPMTGATSNFASSFGTRRVAYPSTTPMCISTPNNNVRPVLQSFFEEQSSTPKNMCVGVDRNHTNLVKETPQKLCLGGAPSVFHKSASGSPLVSKPVGYAYQNSPVPLYPSYHVNTPGASLRGGNVQIKKEVENSAVSSEDNVASNTLATATSTAVVERNPNSLFFGLLMAEFNLLSVNKQKALKKAIMNLVYED